jgi:hypothetical protein
VTAPDPTQPESGPPRTAVAVAASTVVHLLLAGALVVSGITAVRAMRRDPAPLVVADWTPPLPAGVAPAAPELPIPGDAPVVAGGPATRGRTDATQAGTRAAERLATLLPAAGAGVRSPAPRIAGQLGFDGTVPAAWRAESFAGDRTRVAIVVDAGGRTVAALPAIRAVLAQRLGALAPDQEFTLVVARGGGPERAPGTPARATRENVTAALRWFADRAAPGGTPDLGAALARAWDGFDPDAVCIVARGVATVRRSAARSATAGLPAAADRLNPARPDGTRRAQFLCIELVEPATDGAMRTVGERHGGARGYMLIDRAALGLAAPAPPNAPARK